ncbi:4a-hydroxytetrahydrobiopterin dehydratase [Burkholderia ubonensis]|uniref:Putative pterin-4-alpha-carbinolamine dehydratase n=1 Tax=Burkholderia ubonensis subsp. mesacidophila TaxID=265293 RepID=A0A2A4FJR9_9BURK|nr:4a-hydroxytetrahydrobiopterin dehydratase [Burkholderia ubonensis]PCE32922.1 pterin-4-alpha-carbinolamine dehydratase [Burkholderia ubonensis subsp. mesacidophila]
MDDDLPSRHCAPCRGGVPPLTEAQAAAWLARTQGWTLADGGQRIERRFGFRNFTQAYAFVADVARIADEEGHHPDICFGWGWATVSWQTKKINGLHENDFIMAAKTNQLAGS